MTKDEKNTRDEQAASWRERIKELTSTGSAAEESEDNGTARSATCTQKEQSEKQPHQPESARDFIRRKMQEEKEKGGT